MNKKEALLEYLYSCGGTRRYHNRPEIDQNVREHSWGVGMVISVLHPNPSANLLKACLFHDCSEKKYGDFLAPAKDDFPEIKELDIRLNQRFWEDLEGISYPVLTKEEQDWLDFADCFECCLFSKGKHEEVYISSITKSRILYERLVF